MKKTIFWEEFPGRSKEEVSQAEILSAIEKGLRNGITGYISISDLISRTSLIVDEEFDYYVGDDTYIPITYITVIDDDSPPKGWDDVLNGAIDIQEGA